MFQYLAAHEHSAFVILNKSDEWQCVAMAAVYQPSHGSGIELLFSLGFLQVSMAAGTAWMMVSMVGKLIGKAHIFLGKIDAFP